jgi:hypothetical protein
MSNVEILPEHHIRDLSEPADKLHEQVVAWSGSDRIVAVWHEEGQVN